MVKSNPSAGGLLQIVFIVHKVKPVPTHDSVYSVIYI